MRATRDPPTIFQQSSNYLPTVFQLLTDKQRQIVLAFLEKPHYFGMVNQYPMAISNNPLMIGVRGHVGKQVVYRKYGDKTIVSAYPDMSDRKLSKAQKKQNSVMKMAHAEVRKIKANEKLRNEAQLRLNVPREKLHHALLKEQMLKLSKDAVESKANK